MILIKYLYVLLTNINFKKIGNISKKVKVELNEEEFFVLKFKKLNISLTKFCRSYNIERATIIRWSIKYELGGKGALLKL